MSEEMTWTRVRDSISLGEVFLYLLATFCLGAAYRIPNLWAEGTTFYIIAGATCLVAAILVRMLRLVRFEQEKENAEVL